MLRFHKLLGFFQVVYWKIGLALYFQFTILRSVVLFGWARGRFGLQPSATTCPEELCNALCNTLQYNVT